MPLLGFGTLPGGAVGSELEAVTRRAIMPSVVVQFGVNSVTLSSMMASAEPVAGGVSPMTIPVQGVAMTQGAFTDYAGGFTSPKILPALQNAEYNLKAWVVPIPYYLFEGMSQLDADIVPILSARMNDAGNQTSISVSQFLWAAQSANTSLQIFSINDVVAATDPTQGPLGNLPVATNSWWKGNVASIATLNPASTSIMRQNVLVALNYAQKSSGGEPPTVGLCSPAFWTALAADTIGSERYYVDKSGTYAAAGEGATVAFQALNVGGVMIYMDPFITDNTALWLLNFNYLGFKIHREAAFAIAGPESLLPQSQLGYIMAMFLLIETVCTKRIAQSKVTGFTGAFGF